MSAAEAPERAKRIPLRDFFRNPERASFEISPDRLVHTYTLRPGLKFHDGQPVTSKDAVASIKRWMVRNTIGQVLAKFVDKIEATDDKSFTIRLKEPFAFVEFALGSLDADIMRAQDAATDPFKAVTTTIGSGPFRFVRGEWNPGAKVVYEKNPDYVPRPEPPDGVYTVNGMLVQYHTLPAPAADRAVCPAAPASGRARIP